MRLISAVRSWWEQGEWREQSLRATREALQAKHDAERAGKREEEWREFASLLWYAHHKTTIGKPCRLCLDKMDNDQDELLSMLDSLRRGIIADKADIAAERLRA